MSEALIETFDLLIDISPYNDYTTTQMTSQQLFGTLPDVVGGVGTYLAVTLYPTENHRLFYPA
jgi:hypothetical protein